MPKRTTLTLDNDVDALLRAEARRTGRPFRAVVNDALRSGLSRVPARRRRFRVESRDMGLRPEVDLDDVEGLLDGLEGPRRR